MSRYDKYDPKAGGHRAPAFADWPATDSGVAYGVGINATGDVVKGAGATGVIGVCIVNKKEVAGTILDIMRNGEIVEFSAQTGGVNAGTLAPAGTKYYAAANGDINTTNTGVPIGYTVESGRLVCWVKPA